VLFVGGAARRRHPGGALYNGLFEVAPAPEAKAQRAVAAASSRRSLHKEATMSVAKVSEIIDSSPKSFEDAVAIGIERANKTLQNVRGAWIAEQKVEVDNGKIVEFRVTMRVTFVLTE
jgi:flavin-binding protein dodecin